MTAFIFRLDSLTAFNGIVVAFAHSEVNIWRRTIVSYAEALDGATSPAHASTMRLFEALEPFTVINRTMRDLWRLLVVNCGQPDDLRLTFIERRVLSALPPKPSSFQSYTSSWFTQYHDIERRERRSNRE